MEEKEQTFSPAERRYLTLLAKQFPTVQAASRQIIHLQALLNLPKGCEHFISDVHGEYEAFLHVLNSCSGVIREKLDGLFGTTMPRASLEELATLIYYPEEKLADLSERAAYYLKWMLVMCTYNMVGQSMNVMTFNGIFPAGGDSRFGFLCDSVVMWGYSVPMGCLAAFVLKWPVLAVFFILNLDEMVKLPAVYRHYKKYKWVRDLTVHEEGV